MSHTTDAIDVDFSATTTDGAAITYAAPAVSLTVRPGSETRRLWCRTVAGVGELLLQCLRPAGEVDSWWQQRYVHAAAQRPVAAVTGNIGALGRHPRRRAAMPIHRSGPRRRRGTTVTASVRPPGGPHDVNPNTVSSASFTSRYGRRRGGHDSKAFTVHLTDKAPTSQRPIYDVTVAQAYTTVVRVAKDPDGDPVTFTAEAQSVANSGLSRRPALSLGRTGAGGGKLLLERLRLAGEVGPRRQHSLSTTLVAHGQMWQWGGKPSIS